MNFFSAQDAARKGTVRLVVLFTVAVIVLIVLTNLLIAAVVVWMGSSTTTMTTGQSLAVLPDNYWIWTAAGVVGVVALASLYKYLALRGGGRAVAESLGGILVHPSADDLKQRRLLNVVEEMAIASGIGVPPVYLLPDPAINAFAAGFTTDDAVIGVTQGTIDHLTRDELQGVIAHEFSHMLNGDMRINLRLIAVLHGILFIGLIGYGVLRGGMFRSRNAAPVVALGFGLIVIGFTGIFCGNLIKAGISRKREFLADASAVQFTRNPGGIAGALKKIGGAGSMLATKRASEASHMFFGQAVSSFMEGMLATHPPLAKRIRSIEPNWDGRYPTVDVQTGTSVAPDAQNLLAGLAGGADWRETNQFEVTLDADQVTEEIGQPRPEQVEIARALIDTADGVTLEAAHDPWGSRALIYAMLIAPPGEVQAAQLALVTARADKGVPQYLERLMPHIEHADHQHRLTLLHLSMPALKELSAQQYRTFIANVEALIKIDRKIDLFEWVLHRILVKELRGHFARPVAIRATLSDPAKAPQACADLLGALAKYAGDIDAQQHAYTAGAGSLGLATDFTASDDPNFSALNASLKVLRKLKPLAKPKLIKACAKTVLADGHVNSDEAALMQAIAATLDCPLPPTLARRSPGN
ncbi:MAG: M48 family metallopeptidase [Gammaproteobacteria bacterium]|nr:M48 family metallopeptidase [Gammaproteobacteria bacterium]